MKSYELECINLENKTDYALLNQTTEPSGNSGSQKTPTVKCGW